MSKLTKETRVQESNSTLWNRKLAVITLKIPFWQCNVYLPLCARDKRKNLSTVERKILIYFHFYGHSYNSTSSWLTFLYIWQLEVSPSHTGVVHPLLFPLTYLPPHQRAWSFFVLYQSCLSAPFRPHLPSSTSESLRFLRPIPESLSPSCSPSLTFLHIRELEVSPSYTGVVHPLMFPLLTFLHIRKLEVSPSRTRVVESLLFPLTFLLFLRDSLLHVWWQIDISVSVKCKLGRCRQVNQYLILTSIRVC